MRILFLIIATLAIALDAGAQWSTYERENRWGEKTGKIVGARSASTSGISKIGQKIIFFITVRDCSEGSPSLLFHDMGSSWSHYLFNPTVTFMDMIV